MPAQTALFQWFMTSRLIGSRRRCSPFREIAEHGHHQIQHLLNQEAWKATLRLAGNQAGHCQLRAGQLQDLRDSGQSRR